MLSLFPGISLSRAANSRLLSFSPSKVSQSFLLRGRQLALAESTAAVPYATVVGSIFEARRREVAPKSLFESYDDSRLQTLQSG